MLASGIQILELIPQRPPMVMVERLISCDEKTTITQLPLNGGNIFLGSNGLSASGLMEAMAQTAAVRTGWLLKKQPGAENKKAPVGVIGSIKNFRLYFQPVAGMELTITVEVLFEILQATVVNARVEADGRLAAEAELQVFITETEPHAL